MGAEEGERGEGEVRQKEGGWAGGGGERQGERLSSWIERSNACCAPERYFFKKLRKVASSFPFFGWVRSAFGWGRSTCGWDPSTFGSGRSPTFGWDRSTFGCDCCYHTFGWARSTFGWGRSAFGWGSLLGGAFNE